MDWLFCSLINQLVDAVEWDGTTINILTILLENLQQYDEYDQVEEVNNSFLRLQEK
jgi:hypothetical protein